VNPLIAAAALDGDHRAELLSGANQELFEVTQ
jgi:hypothetical protein